MEEEVDVALAALPITREWACCIAACLASKLTFLTANNNPKQATTRRAHFALPPRFFAVARWTVRFVGRVQPPRAFPFPTPPYIATYIGLHTLRSLASF
jgi:hypothetical protein